MARCPVTVVFVDHRTASPGTPDFGVDPRLVPSSRRTDSRCSRYRATATSVHRASTVRRAWAGGPCRPRASVVEGGNRRSRELGLGMPLVQYQQVSAATRAITRLTCPGPRARRRHRCGGKYRLAGANSIEWSHQHGDFKQASRRAPQYGWAETGSRLYRSISLGCRDTASAYQTSPSSSLRPTQKLQSKVVHARPVCTVSVPFVVLTTLRANSWSYHNS